MDNRFRRTVVPILLGITTAVSAALMGLPLWAGVLWSVSTCAGWLWVTRNHGQAPSNGSVGHRRPEGWWIEHRDGTRTICEMAWDGFDPDSGFPQLRILTPFCPGCDVLHQGEVFERTCVVVEAQGCGARG